MTVFGVFTQAIVIIIIIKHLAVTGSCNINICLTWNIERENITFQCKVNDLSLNVEFYNPTQEEEGYCSMPIPTIACHPMHNNTMMQDLSTNTTILILQRHIDDSLNGQWKCLHGTNTDEAIVNITVLKQVSQKEILKFDNCSDEFLEWTAIGASCIFSLFVILYIGNKCAERSCRVKIFKRKCITIKDKYSYDRAKSIIILMLCSVVFLLPYISGIDEQNCTGKQYFIIFGFVMAMLFVVCFLVDYVTPIDPYGENTQASVRQNDSALLQPTEHNAEVEV